MQTNQHPRYIPNPKSYYISCFRKKLYFSKYVTHGSPKKHLFNIALYCHYDLSKYVETTLISM